jgi:hypothetical protein
LERLATSAGGVQVDLVEMADIDRPVCVILERTVPAICELNASAGCMGDQRSLFQLGGSQSVCLPPVLLDKGLPLESQSGGIELHTGLPILDEPTMVGETRVNWLTFYTPGPALRNFYQNGEIF